MNIEKEKAKFEALRAKIKAAEKAEKEAKLFALGTEIQRAIKAKKMNWSDLKVVLEQTVKTKKNRELLGLSEITKKDSEKKSDSSTPAPSFYDGNKSNG